MAREIRKAILLAAGRGKRLGFLTDQIPKPMLEVAGKPLIAHIVDALAENGIHEIAIITGYLAAHIDDWCANANRVRSALRLSTFHQKHLNGTADAMILAKEFAADQDAFMFGWGDILMEAANYRRFLEAARSETYDLMLAVNRVDDPWRGAAVYVDADLRVEKLIEKPAPGTSSTHWNNAGLFASTPRIFDYIAKLKPSPRGELELPEAIAMMIANRCDVHAIDVRGFWSDIGTPEDLEQARKTFPASEDRSR